MRAFVRFVVVVVGGVVVGGVVVGGVVVVGGGVVVVGGVGVVVIFIVHECVAVDLLRFFRGVRPPAPQRRRRRM